MVWSPPGCSFLYEEGDLDMIERIQYIGRTHTHKNEGKHSALENKKSCNKLHSVYMVDADFDQIVDMQDNRTYYSKSRR